MTDLLPCPLCSSTNVSEGVCWVGERKLGKEPAVRCVDCGCRATLAAWSARTVAQSSVKRDDVARALCCPGGCLRTDDCYVNHRRIIGSAHERKQLDAIMALLSTHSEGQSRGGEA